MSRTFQSLQHEIRDTINDNTPKTMTLIKRWINDGVQEIWSRHPWWFKVRRVRFNTVASATGAGTLTVTQGDTAVTGASTAFTSADIGKKISTAVGQPWCTIKTVTSTTAITLDEPWPNTSLSGDTYTIWKDWYPLEDYITDEVNGVDEIISVRNLIDNRPFDKIDILELEGKFGVIEHTGSPTFWYVAPRPLHADVNKGEGGITMGIYPIPDGVYPIELRYMARLPSPPLNADSDVCPLPDDFNKMVIRYALESAAEYGFLTEKAAMNMQRFEDLIARKILRHTDEANPQARLRGFGEDELPQRHPFGEWFGITG